MFPLPNRTKRAFYFIKVDQFMAEQYDGAFGYDWHTRHWAKFSRIVKPSSPPTSFPFRLLALVGGIYPTGCSTTSSSGKQRLTKAKASGERRLAQANGDPRRKRAGLRRALQGITEQYQISYIELDKDIAVDKVCDIFTQINSRGIRLDAFDLINALLKPKGLQLKHMWRDAAPRLEEVETEKMNVYILQVMSILRQGYCSPKYLYFLLPGQEKPIRDPDGTRRKEILIPDIGMDFEARWQTAVDALESDKRAPPSARVWGSTSFSCPMSPSFRFSLHCGRIQKPCPPNDSSMPAANSAIGIGPPSSSTATLVPWSPPAPGIFST